MPISRSQDVRSALNRCAREHRREQGRPHPDREYKPVIVAGANHGIVRATLEGALIIDTDAGMVRQLATGYVIEHVEHAYCMTAHGMQGGSVEHATVRRRARRSPRAVADCALACWETTRLHVDVADVQAAALDARSTRPAWRRARRGARVKGAGVLRLIEPQREREQVRGQAVRPRPVRATTLVGTQPR